MREGSVLIQFQIALFFWTLHEVIGGIFLRLGMKNSSVGYVTVCYFKNKTKIKILFVILSLFIH